MTELRTENGRVLTEAEIEALAAEAEHGYEVSQIEPVSPEARERMCRLAAQGDGD